ncbi:MAG: hypothetical protein Q7S44_02150 [bacterium]|nr:hypothetical protein [bacterium]
MSLEADFYILGRKKEEIIEISISVRQGSSKRIVYLGGLVRMVMFCSIEDRRGSVWIMGRNLEKRIDVVRYQDEWDGQGEVVSPTRPVRIKDEQMISILSRRVPQKEIFIYLDTEGQDFEDAPVSLPRQTIGI